MGRDREANRRAAEAVAAETEMRPAMSKPPPCADPELTREWPDDDDERCPFCNAKYGEPCKLETYDDEPTE
jgi:hypothetical protein